MSKLDDAYNRVFRFEHLLRKNHAFTTALHVVYHPDPAAELSFAEACEAFCDDLQYVTCAVEDLETHREILSDLVTDESEKRAIGGGPNWRERHEKTWARAMELFEP